MLFSFLVTFREGLEIALIVTILLGYLRTTGQKRYYRDIWIGVGAAVALSLAVGIALEVTSHELSGRVLEAFEGFTMLFAVAMLTWMVFWMKRQSAGISRELGEQVDVALSRGSVTALALLAFSSVGREGIETTLFLFAGSKSAASGSAFVIGGLLGFALATAAGVVLYHGAARLPLKQFFFLSGLAVIVLAAGMLANGLGELHEGAIITNLGARPWDTDATLSLTSTFGKFLHTVVGYDSAPMMGQIVAYWTYMIVVLGAYVFMPTSKPSAIRRADPAPSTGATTTSATQS